MEIDDDPPALPSTATLSFRVTRQNRGNMVAPKEPSRSKRLDIWRALNRSDHWVAPVCGPFEVILPEWLDFDTLVWGPQGADFAYMHKELIDEDLMITWGIKDGVPSKLIMGFRDGNEDSHIPLCKMDRLGFLFSRVTNWAAEAYGGSPRSLLAFLSAARVLGNESILDAAVRVYDTAAGALVGLEAEVLHTAVLGVGVRVKDIAAGALIVVEAGALHAEVLDVAIKDATDDSGSS
ncbi:hypothetical protein N0V84_011313 [Fusarium piperis]|uniref:Uncharacterized protein n=1 Tax=Fusarium piperis TaxID=1435070 RepID=A0A9W8TAR7_9HYPO|nr:hypothetical protein N0V84_011313 [Fusarium piperis]